MSRAFAGCPDLSASEVEAIKTLARNLPVVADLSRADALVYCRADSDQLIIVGEAKPWSVSAVHAEPMEGKRSDRKAEPVVFKCFDRQRPSQGHRPGMVMGATTTQDVFPFFEDGRMVAAVSFETNETVRNRHRRRSPVILRAISSLQDMVLHNRLDLSKLSRTSERDALLVLDAAGHIQYLSGTAESLYQRLGFRSNLLKRKIDELGTNEAAFFGAMQMREACELETHEQDYIFIRKAVPLFDREQFKGVILGVTDVTEDRKKEHELRIKSAMLQEVHHRVKNNLQTIAALLRMQARRLPATDGKAALLESVNRILSVAVVHEFLSHDESSEINIKEVGQSILREVTTGTLDPDKQLKIVLNGPSLRLPAQQATSCALIINELLQNAVEHGYAERNQGTIQIKLNESAEETVIEIIDDGVGFPAGFDLERDSNLGLQIVRTLVKEDLHGQLSFENGHGVHARVSFPRKRVEAA
ncbi:MAG TPA: histidine kinase N-terminal domain-containing protein [Chloroflexota bacterium]|nr:histidine kinase N-terminal domain-containing protein [Chloroflexota bacterium]